MDPISFVTGLLGTLDQTVALVKRLQERHESYTSIPKVLKSLHEAYSAQRESLTLIKKDLEIERAKDWEVHAEQFLRPLFKPEYQAYYIRRFNELHADYYEARRELLVADEKSGKKVYRFLKAKSLAKSLRELQHGAYRNTQRLNDMVDSLANATNRREDAETLNAVAAGVDRLEASTLVAARQAEVVVKEQFQPTPAGAMVPCNPPHVMLDFAANGQDGEPDTFEGMMKAAVLAQEGVGKGGRGGFATAVGGVGMGGVGKSCALRGLAWDKDVQRRFADGVYFVSLGKEATLAKVIAEICGVVEQTGGKRLAKELEGLERFEKVVMKAREWFEGRVCLLLVDDVWEGDDVRSSLVDRLTSVVDCNMGSRVAFTTRNRSLCLMCKEIYFHARKVQGKESYGMLLGAAGFLEEDIAEEYRETVQGVLKICCGLPMALSVAGSTVNGMKIHFGDMPMEAWKTYLSSVGKNSDFLLQSVVVNDDYPNLSQTFQISLDALDEFEKPKMPMHTPMTFHEMHRALSVLPKQDLVPMDILKRLWGLQNDFEAFTVAQIMTNSSLLEMDLRFYAVRLHDLLLDFAQNESQKRDDIQTWHLELLDSFIERLPDLNEIKCREWWDENRMHSSYMLANVCRHLIHAGHDDELLSLLLHPLWTARKLRENKINQLESDFALARVFLKTTGRTQIESSVETLDAFQLIPAAGRLSSDFVKRCPSEIWFQLRGRLLRAAASSQLIQGFLDKIDDWAVRPWVRPLSPCLPSPDGALESTYLCDGSVCSLFVRAGEHQFLACGMDSHNLYAMEVSTGEPVKITIVKKSTIGPLSHGSGASPSSSYDLALSRCMAWTRYGNQVTIGSADGGLRICDMKTGSCIKDFIGHSKNVRCVALSPDEKHVISASDDGSIRIWKKQSGEQMSFTSAPGVARVTCCAFSRDSHKIVIGFDDGKVVLMYADDLNSSRVLLGCHERTVRCVVFSKDGKQIASGSNDRKVRVWKTDKGKGGVKILVGHRRSVTCVVFSNDSECLASGAEDGIIRVWGLRETNERRDVLRGHTARVNCLQFSSKDSVVFSGSEDGTVRRWSVTKSEESNSVKEERGGEIRAVGFSRDGSCMASGGNDNLVRVWNSRTGKQTGKALMSHSGWVNYVAFSEDGRMLISASSDKTVGLWDVERNKLVHTMVGHTSRVRCAVFGKSGRQAVSAADDNTVRIWDIGTGTQIGEALTGHTDWIRSVCFSEDEEYVMSASEDKTVRLWRVGGAGRRSAMTLEGHTERVVSVGFSRDGSLAASGSADKTIIVWNTAHGCAQGERLLGHGDWVTCVAFSGDGRRLVSGSRDRTCRLWDVRTGGCLLVDSGFGGDDVRSHPFRKVERDMSCEEKALAQRDSNQLRFTLDSLLWRDDRESKRLGTLECQPKWHYRRDTGTLAAVGSQGVHVFEVIQ